jgi:hypothetical protein
MNTTLTNLFAALLLAASLGGCAAVQYQTTSFTPSVAAEPRAVSAPLQFRLDTGIQRTIRAGSRWSKVGQVAQGAVFKPYQDVFTVEGAHMHEAWLVVQDDRTLVGFYLPAEGGFSPLTPSLPIQLN